MSTHLEFKEVTDIIWGATLFGGGGGGSMSAGISMLNNYAENHGGEKSVSLDMYTPDEMVDGTYSAVTAGMGTPTAIPDDFTPWVLNAFNFFKYVQAYSNREIKYSMAVELGGFNTFVPMLVSLESKDSDGNITIPFLDVDGAARAVPALTTLLFSVNDSVDVPGYNTLPIVLADYRGKDVDYDKVLLDFPNDAKNAALAEQAARDYLASQMDSIAGLSGWMTPKASFSPKTLPYGSVKKAMQVGDKLRTTPAEKVFAEIQTLGVTCKQIGSSAYTVLDGDNGASGGFDKGWVSFINKDESQMPYIKIDFQNENLVVSMSSDNKTYTPAMTAPDITCAFRAEDNVPLTNADFFDKNGDVITGTSVVLGIIKVSDVWWISGEENVYKAWKDYFANVNYTGEIIQYPGEFA